MKRILVIVSILLIISGLAITAIALASTGFSFKKLADKNAINRDFSITEDFDSIEIYDDCGYYDVKVIPTTDESASIKAFGAEEVNIDCSVINRKLTVRIFDDRSFLFTLFDFESNAYVILSVPEKDYRTLKIKTASGDSSVSSMKIRSVDIECASGDIFIEDVKSSVFDIDTASGDIRVMNSDIGNAIIDSASGEVEIKNSDAKNLDIETTSGEISFNRVFVLVEADIETTSGDVDCDGLILQGALKIETTSGDVELLNSDASKISIETTSGDVEGILLSSKAFDAKSTSGEIKVPNTSSGNGECYIRTSSGDIEISVAPIKR